MEESIKLLREGNYREAWERLTIILVGEPHNAIALRLKAITAAQSGHTQEALSLIKRAILIAPEDPLNYSDSANMLGSAGAADRAIENYQRAFTITPQNHIIYYNLANLLRDCGHFGKAVSNYKKSADLNPSDYRPYLNMGRLLKDQGNLLEAIKVQMRAICFAPFAPELLESLADFFRQDHSYSGAIAWYERALLINPFNSNCLINLSCILNENQDLNASRFALRAICLTPGEFRAYVNLGISLLTPAPPERSVTLAGLGLLKEPLLRTSSSCTDEPHRCNRHNNNALESQNRAVLIDPFWPEAYLNRANVLLKLGLLEDALTNLRITLSIEPGLARAYLNYALLIGEMYSDEYLLTHLEHAITLDPSYPDPNFLKSLILLGKGEFIEGWKLYSWRWGSRFHHGSYPLQTHNIWTIGENRGRLWIIPEQGIGDQVLFGRFLSKTQEYIESVIASLDARLIPLFKRSFPNIEFLPEANVNASHYDWHISLGDLPGRIITTREKIDFMFPQSYLISDTARTSAIRKSLSVGNKVICGIAWQSNRKDWGKKKNATLNDLKSLINMDGVTFVSLQYGDVSEQISEFHTATGVKIRQYEGVDNFRDIDGLASLIDACDIVVSTSNSTVHLAGSLGKDTHVLLPEEERAGLWYWKNRQKNRSLWYPSCKLYPKDPEVGWSHALAMIKTQIENQKAFK